MLAQMYTQVCLDSSCLMFTCTFLSKATWEAPEREGGCCRACVHVCKSGALPHVLNSEMAMKGVEKGVVLLHGTPRAAAHDCAPGGHDHATCGLCSICLHAHTCMMHAHPVQQASRCCSKDLQAPMPSSLHQLAEGRGSSGHACCTPAITLKQRKTSLTAVAQSSTTTATANHATTATRTAVINTAAPPQWSRQALWLCARMRKTCSMKCCTWHTPSQAGRMVARMSPLPRTGIRPCHGALIPVY